MKNIQTFTLYYAFYLSTLFLLLFWWLIFQAWFTGDWRLTIHFNRFDEGLFELTLITLTITLLPYAWYLFGE